MITPLQFERVTSEAVTTASDPDWDTLFEIDVPIGEIGNVVIDFRATAQCQYTTASSDFLGASARLLWDDEPLVDSAYIEFDPAFGPPNIDTFAGLLSLQSVVPNVGPGTHTLTVQWACNAPNQQATIFAQNGNVRIEGRS